MPFGAIISGAANLISSGIGARTSKKSQQRGYRQAKALSKFGYDQDVEQWHRANLYNSPESQMQRYTDAGLNPNLIYGQGTPGNAQQAAPKYNVPSPDPRREPVQLSGAYQGYQSAQLVQAQTDNLRAQTKMTLQREISEIIRQHGLSSQNKIRTNSAWLSDNLRNTQLEVGKLQLEQGRETVRQTQAGTKKLKAETTLVDLKSVYQRYENNLKKIGITSSDNIWFRMAVQGLNRMGINITSENLNRTIKGLKKDR